MQESRADAGEKSGLMTQAEVPSWVTGPVPSDPVHDQVTLMLQQHPIIVKLACWPVGMPSPRVGQYFLSAVCLASHHMRKK